jgi:hypothetical protein
LIVATSGLNRVFLFNFLANLCRCAWLAVFSPMSQYALRKLKPRIKVLAPDHLVIVETKLDG